uniref:Cyclin-dependent protein kinase inhibitor SMR2 n=1 Tax=Quercus lobata TaxID=97700 RepID=A0A7N2QXB7_QUELO
MSKDHMISQKNLPKPPQLQVPKQVDDDDDEEGCRTPTSPDHKIPATQSCPPTPRKPARVSVHKRKWTDLKFFENTRREELESFFQSSFKSPRVTSHAVKRRCTSV